MSPTTKKLPQKLHNICPNRLPFEFSKSVQYCVFFTHLNIMTHDHKSGLNQTHHNSSVGQQKQVKPAWVAYALFVLVATAHLPRLIGGGA